MKGRLRSGSKSKDSTINQNQYIDWADFVKKIQQLESRISETNAEKLSQELLSILENQLSLINYRETKIGSNFAHAILRSIRRILFYLDNKIQDRAIFQKATNLIFLIFKDYRIQHSKHHQGSFNCAEISRDGLYYATGNEFPMESRTRDYYNDGGAMQIWELESGRCIRAYTNISGGVGFSDYTRTSWNKRNLLGAVISTNTVAVYDPFIPSDASGTPSNKPIAELSTFGEYGWSRPPYWEWVIDDTCIWAGGMVLMPAEPKAKEIRFPENNFFYPRPAALITLHKKKQWIDISEGKIISADKVKPLKDGEIPEIEKKDDEVLEERGEEETLSSLILQKGQIIQTEQKIEKPEDRRNGWTVSRKLVKKAKQEPQQPLDEVMEDEEFQQPLSLFQIVLDHVIDRLDELPNSQWNLLPIEIQRKLLEEVKSKPELSKFIEPNLLVIYGSPETNPMFAPDVLDDVIRVAIETNFRSPDLAADSFSHSMWETPNPEDLKIYEIWELTDRPDPAQRGWAKCGQRKLSTLKFKANRAGEMRWVDSDDESVIFHLEKGHSRLRFWDVETGEEIAVHKYPPPNDMPPKSNHPWYVKEKTRFRGRETPAPLTPFTNLDPVIWVWDEKEKDWNYIVVFDTGLIVLPEGDEKTATSIVHDTVNFVFDNRYAWPIHWGFGTEYVNVVCKWEDALEHSKLPKGLPKMKKVTTAAYIEEMEKNAFKESMMEAIEGLGRPQCLAYPDHEYEMEEQMTRDKYLTDPNVLKPFFIKCCRVLARKTSGFCWYPEGEITVTPVGLGEDLKSLKCMRFDSPGSCSTFHIGLDCIDWIAKLKMKKHKVKTVWTADV